MNACLDEYIRYPLKSPFVLSYEENFCDIKSTKNPILEWIKKEFDKYCDGDCAIAMVLSIVTQLNKVLELDGALDDESDGPREEWRLWYVS